MSKKSKWIVRWGSGGKGLRVRAVAGMSAILCIVVTGVIFIFGDASSSISVQLSHFFVVAGVLFALLAVLAPLFTTRAGNLSPPVDHGMLSEVLPAPPELVGRETE